MIFLLIRDNDNNNNLTLQNDADLTQASLISFVAGCQSGGPWFESRPIAIGEALIMPMPLSCQCRIIKSLWTVYDTDFGFTNICGHQLFIDFLCLRILQFVDNDPINPSLWSAHNERQISVYLPNNKIHENWYSASKNDTINYLIVIIFF